MRASAEAFKKELDRQSIIYSKLGYQQASGYDEGHWYGGLCSRFLDDENYRESDEDWSDISSIDMDFSNPDRIPFLLVIGESIVSVPKQLNLINDSLWNGGGTGKPDILTMKVSLEHRMWLAVDVRLHKVGSDGSHLKAKQQVMKSHLGIHLGTICDGLALAALFPDVLGRHGCIGLYESIKDGGRDDYFDAAYIHSRTGPWAPEQSTKPNLYVHTVGTNVTSGAGGSIMNYTSVISVESIMENAQARYRNGLK